MDNANFRPDRGGMGIHFSYDASLGSLPAYCNAASTASILDPLFEFLNDGGYVLGIRAVPSTQQQNASNLIQPNQTYEDNINVPEGSYLTMICGVGLDGSQTNRRTAGMFRIRIYDVGSQSYLSDDFVHGYNIAGNIISVPETFQPFYGREGDIGVNAGAGHGPFILPSPIAISSPGQLTIQIVNLSNNANTIDMAFFFAIPTRQHTAISPASVSGNFTRSSIR